MKEILGFSVSIFDFEDAAVSECTAFVSQVKSRESEM